MTRTLVLNATYEPLGVITDRRALILVLNHRATMVEDSGEVLRFAGGEISLPSVVRLNKFVRIPYRHSVPLSRRAISRAMMKLASADLVPGPRNIVARQKERATTLGGVLTATLKSATWIIAFAMALGYILFDSNCDVCWHLSDCLRAHRS